ncbi:hypothetical protein TNIN_258721 [Trichonephila inaurata madagascariensis]|uniref:DUF4817 domain-containing protein n=1 Tax=Trichonephila inaurata madagascariensis TaxID=2747483 RepID=A0A8X6YPP1_9ARAC|nr:hypothetical protein TNIN_258721 [Trichonephila inaurata madagascariensis]
MVSDDCLYTDKMVSCCSKAMCALRLRETKSPKTAQKQIQHEFNKPPTVEKSIKRWLKHFLKTRFVLFMEGSSRPSISYIKMIPPLQMNLHSIPGNALDLPACEQECQVDCS